MNKESVLVEREEMETIVLGLIELVETIRINEEFYDEEQSAEMKQLQLDCIAIIKKYDK